MSEISKMLGTNYIKEFITTKRKKEIFFLKLFLSKSFRFLKVVYTSEIFKIFKYKIKG